MSPYGLTYFLLLICKFIDFIARKHTTFRHLHSICRRPVLHIGGNTIYYKQCSGTLLPQKAAELQNWVQWTHHAEGKTHCEECLKLDGCWFQEELFKLWGYAVEDIPWLKAEIERQSLEKYLSGDYTLGKLDKNGQRINIRIVIERRDTGELVTFLSGWMARPNGLLQMTTPYGDD